MSIIIALVLTLSALFATPAQPASAAQPATIEAPIKASEDASLPTYLTDVSTSEAPDTCEEDDPCWDCQTMGNSQCAPIAQPAQPETCEEDMECWDCESMGNDSCEPATMEQDAYASFDAQFGQPANTQELMLSYVETTHAEPANLLPTQFTVESSNIANTWHVMQWSYYTNA